MQTYNIRTLGRLANVRTYVDFIWMLDFPSIVNSLEICTVHLNFKMPPFATCLSSSKKLFLLPLQTYCETCNRIGCRWVVNFTENCIQMHLICIFQSFNVCFRLWIFPQYSYLYKVLKMKVPIHTYVYIYIFFNTLKS